MQSIWFAKRLHIEDFQASNGWPASWKHRYNTKQLKISRDSSDMCINIVNEFKGRLPDLISTYSPECMFNYDKTGLFYRLLVDKL